MSARDPVSALGAQVSTLYKTTAMCIESGFSKITSIFSREQPRESVKSNTGEEGQVRTATDHRNSVIRFLF